VISRKKIKMRNTVFLAILSICVVEAIILPILVNGQLKEGDIEITTDDLIDFNVRPVILYKKGLLYELGDQHRYYVSLKQDVEYIARIKITAEYGGTYLIRIMGLFTQSSYSEGFSDKLTMHVLETVYTSDTTMDRYVEIIYTPASLSEQPVYTLYFNKTGFAGWWWIILSGIGMLTVLIVIFTFMVFGMISFSKRKKKKGKKKRR